MRERVLNVATGLVVACTLLVTGITVRRELWPAASAQEIARSSARPDRALPTWRTVAERGHRLGPADARVVIIEFADFECPACGALEPVIRAAREKYQNDLAVVYRHFPLPYHRFATPAARASECAADQGRFEQYHALLYATRDSLGLIPADSLATRAGVADLSAFRTCLVSPAIATRVNDDLEAAKTVGATGTPTFIINGRILSAPPSPALLDRLIQASMKAFPNDLEVTDP